MASRCQVEDGKPAKAKSQMPNPGRFVDMRQRDLRQGVIPSKIGRLLRRVIGQEVPLIIRPAMTECGRSADQLRAIETVSVSLPEAEDSAHDPIIKSQRRL